MSFILSRFYIFNVFKIIIRTFLNIYASHCPSHDCETSMSRDCIFKLEMWANAQPDGRPAEYRWRPLFNAAKFG